MPIEERRRIALHHAVAGAWGEEVADTLFELVTPSGQDLATRQDLENLGVRLGQRFTSIDERLTSIDERFDRVDERFELMERRFDEQDERTDHKLAALEHRITATFERRISDAVTSQTRTLVWSQLAALVAVSALAFGLR